MDSHQGQVFRGVRLVPVDLVHPETQKNCNEFKMKEWRQRWRRTIWPFVLGLQLLLEFPDHHWDPEKKIDFTYWESGFVKMTWKFTDWWSRWSCKSTRSWFPLQQYLKSAHLCQTENVTLFSSSHPVSWDHGRHAGLLIETWSHLRHQVSLTEWILNTWSMFNNLFIWW